jgi:hypothetical protein
MGSDRHAAMEGPGRPVPDDHEPWDRGFVTGGRLLLAYILILLAALLALAR